MGSFPAKYNNPENLQQRVGIFKFFFFFFFFSLKFLLSVQSILISLSIIFFSTPPNMSPSLRCLHFLCVFYVDMLWFNFIFGLNFILLGFRNLSS